MTRPDISIAVSLLNRAPLGATEQAKHFLRYVSGPKNYCLAFTGTISTNLLTWQDSSFADGVDHRSRISFIAMISREAFSWSNEEHSVALSTAKLKYMALATNLFPHFGVPWHALPPTFEDNESFLALAINDMTTSRTTHIDIMHHFICDLFKQCAISIPWCPTSDMLAAILTKFSIP
jgi:hypothetical protein